MYKAIRLEYREGDGIYAKPLSAYVICFNFGYLPGGDHSIATSAGNDSII